MTKDETRAMLVLIKANYQYAFRDVSKEDMQMIAATWHDVFSEYDSTVVRYALTECFKESKYAPGIADVLDKIRAATDDSTNEKDWETACRLIRKGNWLTEEEWLETPEHIRRWFGSMTAVKEFANQESGTLQTVTRGQFIKTIGAVKANCRIEANIPDEIKQLAEQMRLKDENNDKGDTPVIEQIPGTV